MGWILDEVKYTGEKCIILSPENIYRGNGKEEMQQLIAWHEYVPSFEKKNNMYRLNYFLHAM